MDRRRVFDYDHKTSVPREITSTPWDYRSGSERGRDRERGRGRGRGRGKNRRGYNFTYHNHYQNSKRDRSRNEDKMREERLPEIDNSTFIGQAEWSPRSHMDDDSYAINDPRVGNGRYKSRNLTNVEPHAKERDILPVPYVRDYQRELQEEREAKEAERRRNCSMSRQEQVGQEPYLETSPDYMDKSPRQNSDREREKRRSLNRSETLPYSNQRYGRGKFDYGFKSYQSQSREYTRTNNGNSDNREGFKNGSRYNNDMRSSDSRSPIPNVDVSKYYKNSSYKQPITSSRISNNYRRTSNEIENPSVVYDWTNSRSPLESNHHKTTINEMRSPTEKSSSKNFEHSSNSTNLLSYQTTSSSLGLDNQSWSEWSDNESESPIRSPVGNFLIPKPSAPLPSILDIIDSPSNVLIRVEQEAPTSCEDSSKDSDMFDKNENLGSPKVVKDKTSFTALNKTRISNKNGDKPDTVMKQLFGSPPPGPSNIEKNSATQQLTRLTNPGNSIPAQPPVKKLNEKSPLNKFSEKRKAVVLIERLKSSDFDSSKKVVNAETEPTLQPPPPPPNLDKVIQSLAQVESTLCNKAEQASLFFQRKFQEWRNSEKNKEISGLKKFPDSKSIPCSDENQSKEPEITQATSDTLPKMNQSLTITEFGENLLTLKIQPTISATSIIASKSTFNKEINLDSSHNSKSDGENLRGLIKRKSVESSINDCSTQSKKSKGDGYIILHETGKSANHDSREEQTVITFVTQPVELLSSTSSSIGLNIDTTTAPTDEDNENVEAKGKNSQPENILFAALTNSGVFEEDIDLLSNESTDTVCLTSKHNLSDSKDSESDPSENGSDNRLVIDETNLERVDPSENGRDNRLVIDESNLETVEPSDNRLVIDESNLELSENGTENRLVIDKEKENPDEIPVTTVKKSRKHNKKKKKRNSSMRIKSEKIENLDIPDNSRVEEECVIEADTPTSSTTASTGISSETQDSGISQIISPVGTQQQSEPITDSDDPNSVSVIVSGSGLDTASLEGRNDLVTVDIDSFLSPPAGIDNSSSMDSDPLDVTINSNQDRAHDMPQLSITDDDFPVMSIREIESSSNLVLPDQASNNTESLNIGGSEISNNSLQSIEDRPRSPEILMITDDGKIISTNPRVNSNETPTASTSQVEIEIEEELPLLRIRTDLFGDEIGDESKEILRNIKEKGDLVKSFVAESFVTLTNAFASETPAKQLLAFRNLRDVISKSYYILDRADADLRAEEYDFLIDVPPTARYDEYKNIAMEEMGAYFLLLLHMNVMMKKPEVLEYRGNIITIYFRVSRILRYFVVQQNPSQSELNFMNIMQIAENKLKNSITNYRPHIVRLWDYLKSWDNQKFPVEEHTVLIEHATIGIKGFENLLKAVLDKCRHKLIESRNRDVNTYQQQQQMSASVGASSSTSVVQPGAQYQQLPNNSMTAAQYQQLPGNSMTAAQYQQLPGNSMTAAQYQAQTFAENQQTQQMIYSQTNQAAHLQRTVTNAQLPQYQQRQQQQHVASAIHTQNQNQQLNVNQPNLQYQQTKSYSYSQLQRTQSSNRVQRNIANSSGHRVKNSQGPRPSSATQLQAQQNLVNEVQSFLTSSYNSNGSSGQGQFHYQIVQDRRRSDDVQILGEIAGSQLACTSRRASGSSSVQPVQPTNYVVQECSACKEGVICPSAMQHIRNTSNPLSSFNTNPSNRPTSVMNVQVSGHYQQQQTQLQQQQQTQLQQQQQTQLQQQQLTQLQQQQQL